MYPLAFVIETVVSQPVFSLKEYVYHFFRKNTTFSQIILILFKCKFYRVPYFGNNSEVLQLAKILYHLQNILLGHYVV